MDSIHAHSMQECNNQSAAAHKPIQQTQIIVVLLLTMSNMYRDRMTLCMLQLCTENQDGPQLVGSS
jgi:hypothetical protein